MRISDWSSDVCSSDLVVLPSEYGIDPTGIGRVIGLTEMGAIKMQLAEEAAADAALDAQLAATTGTPAPAPAVASTAVPADAAPAQIGRASCRDRVCKSVSI